MGNFSTTLGLLSFKNCRAKTMFLNPLKLEVQAQQNPASYGMESPLYNQTGSNPQGREGLMDGTIRSFHFNFSDLYLCLF